MHVLNFTSSFVFKDQKKTFRVNILFSFPFYKPAASTAFNAGFTFVLRMGFLSGQRTSLLFFHSLSQHIMHDLIILQYRCFHYRNMFQIAAGTVFVKGKMCQNTILN